ncbi:cell division protein FtsA [Carboxylicivirga sp. N1Y90]|uniref:cell division protein FtsA n=1 Tax=Carboxylicivirga fragile TaxID=3417571 RepID=UPI003D345D70|nr:cell division protein FtsA [Marinilabiliaceae bacterium N1Y90]
MNQDPNLIAAIDIGTTKIVAIVGRKTEEGKLQLMGMEQVPSIGVKRGVVLNIDETVSSIKQAVSKIEQKLNITLSEVYVGIAGQHIKSLRNRGYRFIETGLEITQSDVDHLFDDNYKIPVEAGEKIMHVIPQDYIVDNEMGVKNPVGMSGRRLEGNFHIVLGRIASVKNIEKCIRRVALQLNDLILEPLASSKSVLTEEEKEAGVVLVDIGGGTTDVAVFYDGIIHHTAVIPFGGNVVTSDIKEGCQVLYKQAESLKVQFGSAMSDMAREDMVVTIPGMAGWEPKEISFKSLAYIIQARMEEIIDYVTFQIESSGCYDKVGAGIVLTGGGALLKNLPELIKYRTGLDVRMGLPDRFLVGDVPEMAHMPMYSTSIGLVISAMERPKRKIIEPELFGEVEPKKQEVDQRSSYRKERQKKEKANYKTGNLFSGIKNGLVNIFDEKDVEM